MVRVGMNAAQANQHNVTLNRARILNHRLLHFNRNSNGFHGGNRRLICRRGRIGSSLTLNNLSRLNRILGNIDIGSMLYLARGLHGFRRLLGLLLLFGGLFNLRCRGTLFDLILLFGRVRRSYIRLLEQCIQTTTKAVFLLRFSHERLPPVQDHRKRGHPCCRVRSRKSAARSSALRTI